MRELNLLQKAVANGAPFGIESQEDAPLGHLFDLFIDPGGLDEYAFDARAKACSGQSFVSGEKRSLLIYRLLQNLFVTATFRACHILAHQPQPPSQAHEHQIHKKAFHIYSLQPQLFID